MSRSPRSPRGASRSPRSPRGAPAARARPRYVKHVLWQDDVYIMFDDTRTRDIIRELVEDNDNKKYDVERSIYCTNLDAIFERYRLWQRELSVVHPYYAVKANDSLMILRLLSNLGCSFAVASLKEAQICLAIDVKPEKIMCNQPYKLKSHLQYYSDRKVNLLCVDSPSEMEKIHAILPGAELLLRIVPIQTTNFEDGCGFDGKFGANEEQARDLIKIGREKNIKFVGISLHISPSIIAGDANAYEKALKVARRLFIYAESLDYVFNVLDIGGGLPGQDVHIFKKVCNRLMKAINLHFPIDMNVKIIAEPGSFLVQSAVTVYASVIGKRTVLRSQLENTIANPNDVNAIQDAVPEGDDAYAYYLNDGVFGSLNFIPWTKDYQPLRVLNSRKGKEAAPCVFFGASCEPFDRLTDLHNSEILELGDWVYRSMAGADGDTLRGRYKRLPEPQYIVTVTMENLKTVRQDSMVEELQEKDLSCVTT